MINTKFCPKFWSILQKIDQKWPKLPCYGTVLFNKKRGLTTSYDKLWKAWDPLQTIFSQYQSNPEVPFLIRSLKLKINFWGFLYYGKIEFFSVFLIVYEAKCPKITWKYLKGYNHCIIYSKKLFWYWYQGYRGSRRGEMGPRRGEMGSRRSQNSLNINYGISEVSPKYKYKAWNCLK